MNLHKGESLVLPASLGMWEEKKKKEKLQTKSLVCVLIGMGMKKQLYKDQQGKKSAGERLV